MKHILYSLCVGSAILALGASGASAAKPDPKKKRHGKGSAQVTAPAKGKASVRTGGTAPVQRSIARPRASSRVTAKRSSVRADRGRTIRESVTPRSTVRASRDVATRGKVRVSRDDVAARSKVRASRDVAATRERELRGDRSQIRAQREVAAARERGFRANRAQRFDRSRNVRITNNWRSDRFRGERYAAFRDYRRQWHDRSWWRRHHSRIIFVSGGWWYWNTGYWYPAWGYDPYYTYPYDGPIYGYGGLTPDQVIINVQTQLQNDGYYVGAIDGILGPQTREAIAAFQADNGLAVTSAVDQPTLETLGLT